MPKLQAVQIDENTVIYIEAEDDVDVPMVVEVPIVIEEPEEVQRGGGKGWEPNREPSRGAVQMMRSFEQIQSTIKVYTKYTLNAFKDAALADVQKVTLEFGVNVGGETGMPYIAKGTVACNVKITVECAFPQRRPAEGVARPPQPGMPSGMPPGVPSRSANPLSGG